MKIMQSLALTSALLASYMGNTVAQERTSDTAKVVLKEEQGIDLRNEENLNRYLDEHFVFPKDMQQAQTFRTLFKELAKTKIGRDTLAKMPKEKVVLTCFRTRGNAGYATMSGRNFEVSLQVFKASIFIHELGHIDDFSKGRGVNEYHCHYLANLYEQERRQQLQSQTSLDNNKTTKASGTTSDSEQGVAVSGNAYQTTGDSNNTPMSGYNSSNYPSATQQNVSRPLFFRRRGLFRW